MTHRSDNPKKIKHLTLVWVREASDGLAAPKIPEPKHPEAGSPTQTGEPDTSEVGVANPWETLLDGYFGDDDVADLPDDYFDTFDDVDPEEVEQVRLQFIAMDSTEELSQAFLGGDWWMLPALHDELRRACSGSGKLSRLLARRAGFEFIVGLAESLAYCGDGPLSTPLQFTSEFPEPRWNEEVITLNAPHRQDAVELSGCFSFMMH